MTSEGIRRVSPRTHLNALEAVAEVIDPQRHHNVFPIFKDENGYFCHPNDKYVIRSISDNLPDLRGLDTAVRDEIRDRARESLTEVTHLTEYQDQKAIRNLTAVAFLTALSGIIFNGYVQTFPLAELFATLPQPELGVVLAGLGYALFGVFILCVTGAALLILTATRTTFRYDASEQYPLEAFDVKPKSMLFYQRIIETPPTSWAKAFDCRTTEQASANEQKAEIIAKYAESYIIETYLISCKIADKVRLLVPAQRLLSTGLIVFLIWILVFYGAVMARHL